MLIVLKHEMVHVAQMRKLGILKFYWQNLIEKFRAGYWQNRFEKEAFAQQYERFSSAEFEELNQDWLEE